METVILHHILSIIGALKSFHLYIYKIIFQMVCIVLILCENLSTHNKTNVELLLLNMTLKSHIIIITM